MEKREQSIFQLKNRKCTVQMHRGRGGVLHQRSNIPFYQLIADQVFLGMEEETEQSDSSSWQEPPFLQNKY